MESMSEPVYELKYLDAVICDQIYKCIQEAETEQEIGVFQTDIWKLFRQRYLPE